MDYFWCIFVCQVFITIYETIFYNQFGGEYISFLSSKKSKIYLFCLIFKNIICIALMLFLKISFNYDVIFILFISILLRAIMLIIFTLISKKDFYADLINKINSFRKNNNCTSVEDIYQNININSKFLYRRDHIEKAIDKINKLKD